MMYWVDVGRKSMDDAEGDGKGLGATLVDAVELFELFLIILKEWWVVVGTVKMTVVAVNWNPLKAPLAILWPQNPPPPPPLSCELRVAPFANLHNRQPGIIHQLMRQPPKALPMGLCLCTIWRRACSAPFPTVPSGNSREQTGKSVSSRPCSWWQTNHKRRHLYPRAESDIITEGTKR